MASPDRMLQSYYAARAGEYDAVYAKPERQDDLRAIERWLPPRFRARTVLEIACGTGYWTRWIAQVAAAVVAIDAAPETLEVARDRLHGVANVELLVGDAYALPRRARVFDAAFAGFWFSHVPRDRRREFLAGLHATLAPGARVVLLDNAFVAGSSSPIAETDASGDTFQHRTLRDGSVHRVLKNFPGDDELRTIAAASGGDAVEVHRWQHYWALAYRAPWR